MLIFLSSSAVRPGRAHRIIGATTASRNPAATVSPDRTHLALMTDQFEGLAQAVCGAQLDTHVVQCYRSADLHR